MIFLTTQQYEGKGGGQIFIELITMISHFYESNLLLTLTLQDLYIIYSFLKKHLFALIVLKSL